MNENQKDVSFAAFESACARLERANHRLFIVAILLLAALLATNAAWIYYESQFEDVYVQQEVDQDTESGNNAFIGGDFYGKAESDNDDAGARP